MFLFLFDPFVWYDLNLMGHPARLETRSVLEAERVRANQGAQRRDPIACFDTSNLGGFAVSCKLEYPV